MAKKTLSMPEVYRRYKPRILGLLDEVRAAFGAAGYRLDEPFEMSDEEYQWRLDGGAEPGNPVVSAGITIIESRVRGGADELGINFSLDLTGRDGEVRGTYTPNNYGPEVWASRKDPSAIEARWRMFEEACAPSAIVPYEVNRRYRVGEFFDPRKGDQAREVVASFALLGRLGGIQAHGGHYNVVSIWPRSMAGIPGKLKPVPDLLGRALPDLLRAFKGDGRIVSYGMPARIDDDWIVVVEGELGPLTVGEYLAGQAG